jgi:hypothetical protein
VAINGGLYHNALKSSGTRERFSPHRGRVQFEAFSRFASRNAVITDDK